MYAKNSVALTGWRFSVGSWGSYTKVTHTGINGIMESQCEQDWWSIAVWKGPDDRTSLQSLVCQTPLATVLAEIDTWITGDHQIFMVIAGVRPASIVGHDHLVCAQCRATKGDVLDGDPFVVWQEQLHETDILPTVPVERRCECPLHGTRIIASQLLN